MDNYIQIGGPIISTEGPLTDVTSNVISIVVAAVAHSNVLNDQNTDPPGEQSMTSIESKAVVFTEIKRYLDYNLGIRNYSVTIPKKRFEW